MPKKNASRSSSPPIPQTAEKNEPLTLQCSCKCGENVFSVSDVNRRESDKESFDTRSPLTFLDCHCRGCRLHAGAAWGCWLTRAGAPFSWRDDVVFARSNVRVIPVECGSARQFFAPTATGKSPHSPSLKAGDSAAAKVLCAVCHSVLALRFGACGSVQDGAADQCVVAAGALEDGDYQDDDAGRKPDESVWPQAKFPQVLGDGRGVHRSICDDERAGWYVQKAGTSRKAANKREKALLKQAKQEAIAVRSKQVANNPNSKSKLPPPEVRGSCYCGACQYESRLLPGELQHCYCQTCRKLSGSAFMTWAPLDNAHLTWLDGTVSLQRAEPRRGSNAPTTDAANAHGRNANNGKDAAQQSGSAEVADEAPLAQSAGLDYSAGARFPALGMRNAAASADARSPFEPTNATMPRCLEFRRTTEFGGRHFCKVCGTCMTIVYDDEAADCTWLAPGCYLDESLSATNAGGPRTFRAGVPDPPPEGEQERPGAASTRSRADSDSFESARSSPPQRPGSPKNDRKQQPVVVTAEEKDKARRQQEEYVREKMYNVVHICCASVPTWYDIPKDVGTDRIALAS